MSAKRASILMWSLLGGVVLSLTGGGWYVRDFVATELASKDEVIIVAQKADFAIDRQMEAVIAQIAHLDGKAKKTPEEIEQLKYLRQQLELMRKIRRGK